MKHRSDVYNIDCMEYMRTLPDKSFDLAIVDPPYGIEITSSGRLKRYNSNDISWDNNIPKKKYFDELFRVSANQIIWGGNYFLDYLHNTKCFLIYDKKQPLNISFASCEFAWTSFDSVSKTFYYSPMRMNNRIHTTQKPIELYAWILKNYAKQGDTILDTHLGSGSSRIAAYKMGFDFVGCEIDKEYFDKSVERFNRECLGEYKEKSGKITKQLELFK
jgi:site-specific DNA-methyltransferase (adenine-specific)